MCLKLLTIIACHVIELDGLLQYRRSGFKQTPVNLFFSSYIILSKINFNFKLRVCFLMFKSGKEKAQHVCPTDCIFFVLLWSATVYSWRPSRSVLHWELNPGSRCLVGNLSCSQGYIYIFHSVRETWYGGKVVIWKRPDMRNGENKGITGQSCKK